MLNFSADMVLYWNKLGGLQNLFLGTVGCRKLGLWLRLFFVLYLLVANSDNTHARLGRHARLKLREKGSRISSELNARRSNLDLRTTERVKREVEPEIWPHKCRKPFGRLRTSTIPVAYECEPQVWVPFRDPDPELTEIPPPEKTNDTTSPRTTDSSSFIPTTRSPRHMHALVNATYQFDVPGDVTTLRLWYQNIVSIEDGAFVDLSRLQMLNLQHNQISYLGASAFHGLSQLTELDLSYNRLQSIPSFTFVELSTLEVLALHHNEISSVQNALFCGLGSLSTLDLSHNTIEDIGSYALRHFRSRYTVSIEVGHNRLKTPKKEWLIRGPKYGIDPVCQNDHTVDNESTFEVGSTAESVTGKIENVGGMEIVVKRPGGSDGDAAGIQHTSKIVLPPVRMMRAAHNPWSCVCDTKFCIIQFVRLYKSIVASQFNGGSVEDKIDIFRTHEINSTTEPFPTEKHDVRDTPMNKTDPEEYLKWYFTMPCSDREGIDLGRLSEKEQADIERTCCELLTNNEIGIQILAKDHKLRYLCEDGDGSNNGQLTDNHVTIIGIVIVFSTPILLTLCPDCNRTVAPSSGGAFVGGGKFGGMSVNNNNNNNTVKFSWNQERRPFNNDRFCLVVQAEKKSARTFYVEKVV